MNVGARKSLKKENHYFIVFVMPLEAMASIKSSAPTEAMSTGATTFRISSTIHHREYVEPGKAASPVDLIVYSSPTAAGSNADPGVTDQQGGPEAAKFTIVIRDLDSDLDGNQGALLRDVPIIAAKEFPGHLYYQLCCVKAK